MVHFNFSIIIEFQSAWQYSNLAQGPVASLVQPSTRHTCCMSQLLIMVHTAHATLSLALSTSLFPMGDSLSYKSIGEVNFQNKFFKATFELVYPTFRIRKDQEESFLISKNSNFQKNPTLFSFLTLNSKKNGKLYINGQSDML